MDRESGIDSSKSEQEVTEYLRKPSNRSAVDYLRLVNEACGGPILIGDTHPSLATKRDFIASLTQLKAAGISEVDFELVPFAMQDQLSAYANLRRDSRSSKEAIVAERGKFVEHFLNIWDNGPDLAEGRRMAEQLTDMVDGVIDSGLKPVGIEPPVERFHQENEGADFFHQCLQKLTSNEQTAFDQMWRSDTTAAEQVVAKRVLLDTLRANGQSDSDNEKFARILEQMRTGNSPLHLAGLALPRRKRGDNYYDPEYEVALFDWRNENWLRVIESQVHDGKAIVVFAGSGHFGYAQPSRTINEMLADVGIKSLTINKSGGDIERVNAEFENDMKKSNLPFERSLSATHSIAASAAGVGHEHFSYRLKQQPRPADYVIHLTDEI